MKLSTAKDKVLKAFVNNSPIKELNIDGFLFNSALVELAKDGFIDIIHTSVTGTGNVATYERGVIYPKSVEFIKSGKSFRKLAFWDAVKDFIKSYWAVIVFIIPTTVGIIQYMGKASLQKENQELRIQLQQLKDSLHLP